MMDRTYGVSTSELRGEDRNFKVEQEKRELDRIEKSNENLIKLNNMIIEIVLHCLELKENPLKDQQELKPLITRSLLVNKGLDKNKKVFLMLDLGLDLASNSTKELIKIKSEDRNVYKVYLAASVFSDFAENELNYMSQVKEMKNIVNLELKKSLEKGFAGKNLDTKTLIYLARQGLLK